MAETKAIEIDFDVHKLIESKRTSFAENPNAVLRRLLNLGEPRDGGADVNSSDRYRRAWTGKGVTLPAGTKLRMEYRGREHRGVIDNAAWVIDGQRFKSPSAAAGGVAVTKNGGRPSLDGWKYWQVKRPSDAEWVALATLR